MRVSDHIIFVELPNDEILIVHGYTGAIDIMTKDIVGSLKKNRGLQKIDSSQVFGDNAELLYNRGYLTELDEIEELKLKKKLIKSLRVDTNPFALVFVLTYECNFGCIYCFENGFKDTGKNKETKIMTKETVDNCFNFLKEKSISGTIDYITLFGGEPLYPSNKEIIEYIVYRANEAGYGMSITTNGFFIDYYKDILPKINEVKFQITLDGDAEVHDKRRPLKNGNSTFEKIVDNIRWCLDQGFMVYVRHNIDTRNIESIITLYDYLKDVGFLGMPNFAYYFAETYDKELERRITLKEIQDTVQAERPDIEVFRYGQNINFMLNQLVNSYRNENKYTFRSTFCGAMNYLIAVDPHGDIYPCIEVGGIDDEIVGSISKNTGAFEFKDRTVQWKQRNVGNIPECLKCPYALYCGGGCTAQAKREFGNIYHENCAWLKDAFDIAGREFVRMIQNKEITV